MKPKTREQTTESLRKIIEARAYELWERDGRPNGRHAAHWLQAEAEILNLASVPTPAPKKAKIAPKAKAAPKTKAAPKAKTAPKASVKSKRK